MWALHLQDQNSEWQNSGGRERGRVTYLCPVTVDSHLQKRNNKNYKKTYGSLCPLRVDWQFPDCESQILMVLSLLPLAICFPSGLHATDWTLKLWEVRTRINRSKEGKTWKNLPIPVPPQRRLAISRLRVPNLDVLVLTATGNLFSIGAPRHRQDPKIVRSQDTNQTETERGKFEGKKIWKKTRTSPSARSGRLAQQKMNLKKTYSNECPLSVNWQSPDCESQILMVSSILPLAICFPSGLHATE